MPFIDNLPWMGCLTYMAGGWDWFYINGYFFTISILRNNLYNFNFVKCFLLEKLLFSVGTHVLHIHLLYSFQNYLFYECISIISCFRRKHVCGEEFWLWHLRGVSLVRGCGLEVVVFTAEAQQQWLPGYSYQEHALFPWSYCVTVRTLGVTRAS